MKCIFLPVALLALIALSFNLNASPDLGLYEYERPFAGDALRLDAVDFTTILKTHTDDVGASSGTSSPSNTMITSNDSGSLTSGHTSRFRNWLLTDACLRQLLAPIPI